MGQNAKYINIEFPFQESKKGAFLNLNQEDAKAVRSDLMHLILTRKGERLYNPEFGRYTVNSKKILTKFRGK
jgi:hypothetical protein